MKLNTRPTLVLTLIFLFTFVGTASAQEAVGPEACSGDLVDGTVVGVDETTNTATVQLADGTQCTVQFGDGDYGDPVTNTLAEFFGQDDIGTEDLAEALGATQVCAVYDDVADSWSNVEVPEGEECPGTSVSVSGKNEDGTYNATDEFGDPIILSLDEGTAALVDGALTILNISWGLSGDGAIADTGQQIADYHEDGIGFGVLVKLFAMAAESQEACQAEGTTEGEEPAECGFTVDSLLNEFEDGHRLGNLFQTFGKPSFLGVGHIRQELNGGFGASNSNGACNAFEHSNGNGHAGEDCDEEEPTILSTSSNSPGKGNSNGNNGKGKGHNK